MTNLKSNGTNHQGNASQKHKEIGDTLVKMPIIEKAKGNKCYLSIPDVEQKKEHLHIVYGKVNWCGQQGKQYGGFSKEMKNRTTL